MRKKRENPAVNAAGVSMTGNRIVPAGKVSLFLDAAAHGDCATMLKCLEQGIHLNVVNNKKQNALHLAAMNGREEAADSLISLGIPLNSQDMKGNTAMMLAAAGGYGQVVNKLVLANADVFLRNTRGETVMHYAAAKCGPGVMTGLLIRNSKGARDQDNHGNTPLAIAGARAPFSEQQLLVFLLENWYFRADQKQKVYCRRECLCNQWNLMLKICRD